jgi:phosphatidylethanolamine-binding protein (PEBP) family uncharacterized protein
VAQRTGAERLIAPSAKTTSARLCLALVAAALLLPGCGGGSSEPESTTATGSSSSSAQAAAHPDSPGPGAAENSSSQGEGGSAPGQPSPSGAQPPAGAPAAQGQPPGQGQKHGPAIAPPKGPREQAPAPADIADLTVADMSLSSPSLPSASGGPAILPATYTCDGKGGWPALSWSGVPNDTAELILYAMNIAPVEGKLFVDWAVAGLDAGLTGIEAGELPKGAVVGTSSFGKRGYEICPGDSEIYLFAVYALPRALSPRPGFDARELRKQVLDVSGNVGLLSVTYTRG